MPDDASRLKVQRSNGICEVEFADRKILDELCIAELSEELARLVQSEPGVRLLLNFQNVDHLSSAALGMLINLQKEVKTQDGLLKLSEIRPQIMEVFKITRLDQIFDIHDTAAGARGSF